MTVTFGWPALNWALAAPTLLAGSVAGDLGPGQLQNDQGAPSTAWQTDAGVLTPGTGAWVQFELPEAREWQLFSVHRTNLTEAAMVRWRVAGAAGLASPVYDSGLVPAGVLAGFGQSVLALQQPVAGTLCRLDISDPSNPDGFVNVPLLYAGAAWAPERNMAWDSAPGATVEQDEVVTRGGQEFPSYRFERRTWSVSLQELSDADMRGVQDMLRSARTGGNVLLLPEPESDQRNREALFGRLRSGSDFTYRDQTLDRRAWRGQMTERL